MENSMNSKKARISLFLRFKWLERFEHVLVKFDKAREKEETLCD